MDRQSTTGNKTWLENIKNHLNTVEDRNKLFDILKQFPRFVENEVKVGEMHQLLKFLGIDDCCASIDQRSIRFFFLREELYNNAIKVYKLVITDDE